MIHLARHALESSQPRKRDLADGCVYLSDNLAVFRHVRPAIGYTPSIDMAPAVKLVHDVFHLRVGEGFGQCIPMLTLVKSAQHNQKG